MRVWTTNFDDNKDGKFFNFNIIKINAEVFDKRTIEKFEKEFLEMTKASFKYAFARWTGSRLT